MGNVINELSHYPHGIVSQNTRENILSFLSQNQLQSHFPEVIGYEEIGYDQQKPDPTGLLACIESVTNSAPGLIFYIGDHETDTQCAHLANQELKKNSTDISVHSIAALYGSSEDPKSWNYQPDFSVQSPNEILPIISSIVN